ncbi:MAG: peptide chain release factor 2, partial [Firmicutes bacterium]|nr:peptide chain release factor 2 [Candidatus Scatoplasma merdavium]
MKELYELNSEFSRLEAQLEALRGSLDEDNLSKQIEELSLKTQASDFWNDRVQATKINSKLASLEDLLNSFKKLEASLLDVKAALELLKIEDDTELHSEVESSIKSLVSSLSEFETELYLNGEYDSHNAILEFHPGAGGTEAHDWAQMLFRMYVRYAEKHRFKVEVVSYLEGEEAGISSATIIIKGKNAFGLLKSERGVHRLVRISPFDAGGSRHTSFASVNVMPEFNNDIDLKIEDKDLRIDTFRSQGAGGQNVNKTESAVRITHIPTGIAVYSEVERSQIQNREIAMNLLRSRLFQLYEQERQEKLRKINGDKKNIEWGSQIRSYVFCPYTLVKDHRSDYEEKNVASVMDGNIDGFIQAY